MPVIGADTIANNIKSFGGGFKNHVKKVMVKVTNDLDKDVTKNMSYKRPSLKKLAEMGHPYARRHGEKGSADMPHSPYWKVHSRSGKLLKSKDSGVIGPAIDKGRLQVSGYVKLNEADTEYANSVIWGTSVMIPRDFLSGSLSNKTFQRKSKKYLTQNLRDMVFSFRGRDTR